MLTALRASPAAWMAVAVDAAAEAAPAVEAAPAPVAAAVLPAVAVSPEAAAPAPTAAAGKHIVLRFLDKEVRKAASVQTKAP